MRNLSILMIGGLVPWHPDAGGGQIVAYKLSEALGKKGLNITYVAICPEHQRKKVKWCNIKYLNNSKFFPQLLKSFREEVKNYDLIHIHAGNETTGFYLGYALRQIISRGKLIIGIYAPKVHKFPRSFSEAFLKISSRFADAIFCLSEFSENNISEAYRISPLRIKVMYAGVDESFFNIEIENKTIKNNFNLLFCGRLNGREQKGVDILLNALPLILKKHNVILNIIGSGVRLQEYRALARRLGIDKQVRLLGFIEYEKLPKYYKEADLYVLPSRRESFGMTFAEAMASGLSVVSTNVTAIPEVVEDGETGILVQPNNPQKFAEAVNYLLDNPERMKLMGLKGRERVKKYFTWEKVAERVIEFYKEIL